jgi:hypothetical protein
VTLHLLHLTKAAFATSSKKVQNRLRSMQNKWLSDKAEKIQTFDDRHDSKRFFDSAKAVYDPHTSGSAPLTELHSSPIVPRF